MLFRSDKIISFSINVDGQDRRISFNSRMDGGSVYSTHDKDEQAALLRNDMCARGVYYPTDAEEAKALLECLDGTDPEQAKLSEQLPKRTSVQNRKKGAKSAQEETKEVMSETVCDASSWQEAADYLADKYEVSYAVLESPDAILDAAGKLGVVFPNL